MESFMKYINRISRCSDMYRGSRLRASGLNSCQHIYILKICQNPGISQDELSRLSYVNKSNVTRQLAALEENGFIRREADSGERRVQLVYPTQKADDICPRVRELMQAWNRRLTEDFSDEERELLLAMLKRMMEKAEQEVAGL